MRRHPRAGDTHAGDALVVGVLQLGRACAQEGSSVFGRLKTNFLAVETMRWGLPAGMATAVSKEVGRGSEVHQACMLVQEGRPGQEAPLHAPQLPWQRSAGVPAPRSTW